MTPPSTSAATAPAREFGATIVALLEGGPLAGRRIEAEVVEGRPPKTLDVDGDDGGTRRYTVTRTAHSHS